MLLEVMFEKNKTEELLNSTLLKIQNEKSSRELEAKKILKESEEKKTNQGSEVAPQIVDG